MAEGTGLKCAFFDKSASFEWHAGMMLPNSRLQVPFFADLVTLADPCNKFSYMAYLKAMGRLFKFAIHEQSFVTRKEYNAYCKWVVGQLDFLYFNISCELIQYNSLTQLYEVFLRNRPQGYSFLLYAKHIVLGVGTVPSMPDVLENENYSKVFHSSNYLFNKKQLQSCNDVTIIGSGQSAAEIFYDLLQDGGRIQRLSWFTRSSRFFPMDYSKLSLEMTSPNYIDHFYSLPIDRKPTVLGRQNSLYKGINFSLVNDIYDCLYLQEIEGSTCEKQLNSNCALMSIREYENKLLLNFEQEEMGKQFEHTTELVVMATGYKYVLPQCIEPLRMQINWLSKDQFVVNRNYSIDKKGNSLFVQNAEMHTHGFNSPDLGMGPYRNSVILNYILGEEYFAIETNVCFQGFGVPKDAA